MEISDPTFWIPTLVSIIAVILFYIDMRWRLKQGQDVTGSMLRMIELMRGELSLFEKQTQKGQLTSVEIERQKLLQRQREQQWRETKDTIQGLAWLAKIAKQFERLDEDED